MANKLMEALDPRVPIYRDSYNEYFVVILSAGGAVAGTAVPLYIVMAILDDLWSPGIFIAACVVFELGVIFGLARPQMKPLERIGWVLLWGAVTARARGLLLLPGRRADALAACCPRTSLSRASRSSTATWTPAACACTSRWPGRRAAIPSCSCTGGRSTGGSGAG